MSFVAWLGGILGKAIIPVTMFIFTVALYLQGIKDTALGQGMFEIPVIGGSLLFLASYFQYLLLIILFVISYKYVKDYRILVAILVIGLIIISFIF